MILIKSFSLPKEDGPLELSLDRKSLNPQNLRFAVADGVTRSFKPEITADALAHFFTHGSFDFDQFPQVVSDDLLPALALAWDELVDDYMKTLDPIDFFDESETRKERPAGSSTLVGVELDTRRGRVGYHILGDSTLYLLRPDMPLLALNTSPKVEVDGVQVIDFSSSTACVKGKGYSCDGPSEFVVAGNWLSGYVDVNSAKLALMTDGVAAWFQHEYLQVGEEAFDRLWQLRDNTEFAKLARSARDRGFMIDDLTTILIKVECEK